MIGVHTNNALSLQLKVCSMLLQSMQHNGYTKPFVTHGIISQSAYLQLLIKQKMTEHKSPKAGMPRLNEHLSQKQASFESFPLTFRMDIEMLITQPWT